MTALLSAIGPRTGSAFVCGAARWIRPRCSPAGQARAWQDAGFVWLHVVDLNSRFAGRPVNAAAVAAILSATTVPVQLGGSGAWPSKAGSLPASAAVMLGSAAAKSLRQACRGHFPGHIVVGIDARGARPRPRAGPRGPFVRALDLALSFEDAGRGGDHTDIGRDGMLAGSIWSRPWRSVRRLQHR